MKKTDKKVLLVEDDKDYLWLLRQNFDSEGIPVIYALDGEQGLEMAKKEKPDLIVVDILMPKMDGIEMAKKIKENGINAQIIFLTNLKDEAHISQAVEALDETDYIIKSDVHIDQIVARVREKLEKI